MRETLSICLILVGIALTLHNQLTNSVFALILVIFPISDHLPKATTSPRTKGGRLRESWLYKEKPELAPRTLRVEPSREAPRAITYIHTLFEIGSIMGSQGLMWTYIKAALYK